jgi:hypothetical protein
MARRGRPAKRVVDHIRDGTFRMSKHGHLVEEQFPGLRDFGERYAEAESESERRAIRQELEQAVEAASQLETLEQFMCASVFLDHNHFPDLTYQEWEELYADWRLWDAAHGLPWRVRHGCIHNVDKTLLHQLVAEDADDLQLEDFAVDERPATFAERTWFYIERALCHEGPSDGLVQNVNVLNAQLDELLAAYREDYADVIDAAPDPPGWELVA